MENYWGKGGKHVFQHLFELFTEIRIRSTKMNLFATYLGGANDRLLPEFSGTFGSIFPSFITVLSENQEKLRWWELKLSQKKHEHKKTKNFRIAKDREKFEPAKITFLFYDFSFYYFQENG